MFADSARPRRKLSLTPLIDVVFLLLVFFMLTTNFSLQQELSMSYESVEMDEASTQASDDTLVIELIDGDRIRMQGASYSLHQGQRMLSRVIENNPSHAVVISAGKNANVQMLVNVIGALEVMGAKNVTYEAVK